MEKLDKFYDKVNGSYCGIIAVLIAGVSVIVAQILYTVADPTFSMTSNFISDLGAGPNNSDIVFNVGEIISGIFYIPFFIYVGWYLQKKGGKVSLLKKGMIAGFIVGVARSLIGVFPVGPENSFTNNMHILLALILFMCASIMAFIYGISERKIPEIPIILTLLSFCYAIFDLAFIISAFMDNIIGVPTQVHTFLIEWSAFYIGLIWAIAHIYYILKHK